MNLLTNLHKEHIHGILSCYDRVIITGTLPQISYSGGITSYLYNKGIRIFDYPKFAESFRDTLRLNAETLAKENNIEIEFVAKSHVRKEDIVKKVLEKRGNNPGLVHILSAMESCSSYRPWHDKSTGKTYLRGSQSKCLHYYFYFIDPYLGFGYIRVPTWCTFKLQIYFNGHNILANELDKHGIKYSIIDNAFDFIEDIEKAQILADEIDVRKIHVQLDKLSQIYCPVQQEFDQPYRWSIMQAEYATDIVFKKQKYLQSIYTELVTTAIHTVKPDNVATFLSRKVDPKYQGEIGNNYNVRIEGSRIKHSMGKSSIKMYDKFFKILRIETTTNDEQIKKDKHPHNSILIKTFHDKSNDGYFILRASPVKHCANDAVVCCIATIKGLRLLLIITSNTGIFNNSPLCSLVISDISGELCIISITNLSTKGR